MQHEQRDERCLQVGYSQRRPRGWPRPGSLFVEAATRCNSGSGQPLSGLSQRVAGPATHPPLATRSVWEQMPWDAQVTFPGRVPPLSCCRGCLAGYGQSRRAPGLPFRSACDRVTERHSGGNLSALIMPDLWSEPAAAVRHQGPCGLLTEDQQRRTAIRILVSIAVRRHLHGRRQRRCLHLLRLKPRHIAV